MTPKSIGFKMGLATSALHLLLVLLAYAAASSSQSSTAGLVFIYFFSLDAPLLFLANFLPGTSGELLMGSPLIIYGLLGSLLWFALPWLVDRLLVRIFPHARRWIRWVAVVACLPVFLFAFIPLSNQTISMSIRDSRPAELKALLKNPATGVLIKRTVLEEDAFGGVCGIHCISATGEILVAFHRSAVHLDLQYAEKNRLSFSNYFQTVQPVRAGDVYFDSYIVHVPFAYAALLGPDGIEQWRFAEKAKTGLGLEGVTCGDINGDGQPEFAVYYRYERGIVLLDETGRPLWTHPIYSLGHLEMADVRSNGKQEILYSNSNNARSSTVFKTVNADGKIVAELKLTTCSSEFALVDWPAPQSQPNLLLTEENQIRIVDLDGNEIRRLEAPGCRSYGAVTATAVRFRADAPPFLVVRKNLHPDLAVLYVYDAEGRQIDQDVEIRMGGSGSPGLAAVPGKQPGTERLLVGSEIAQKPRILEYSLD